ncbi:PRC-barrel domain-containing protein [Phyllobacterium zundukense]
MLLIGKLNAIVIDANGRIEAAVIGVGGFLGIGGKDVCNWV